MPHVDVNFASASRLAVLAWVLGAGCSGGSSSECEPGLTRAAGACRVACNADSDCSTAEVCYQGSCQEALVNPRITAGLPVLTNQTTLQLQGTAVGADSVSLYSKPDCTGELASGTAHAFADSGLTIGLTANATNTVYLRSFASEERRSRCVKGGETIHDGIAPTFAGANSASSPSLLTVQVAWEPASDNITAQDSIVYEICRSTVSGGCIGFAATATSASGATGHTFSGLTEGTHYFMVRARDEAGNVDGNTIEVSAAVSCPSGYSLNGAECTWSGVIQNGDFDSVSGWDTTGSANVDTAHAGCDDGGAGMLSNNALCGLSEIVQTVTMPSLEESAPMVLDVNAGASATCDAPGWIECQSPRLGVAVNGTWHSLNVAPNVCTNTSHCLGDLAYGHDVTLRFSGQEIYGTCGSDVSDAYIDNVNIRPATVGECPPLGVITNGNFEAGEEGWDLETVGTEAIAQIVTGVGAFAPDGGDSLHLMTETLCQHARARQRVALPDARRLAHPAMRLRHQGTSGGELRVNFDDVLVGAVRGKDEAAMSVVCVPAAMRGKSIELMLELNAGSTSCGTTWLRNFFIDDIEFVSDARCSGNVPAGDFENTTDSTPLDGWVVDWHNDPAMVEWAILDGVSIFTGATGRLGVWGFCDAVMAYTPITVPWPTASAGPALRFRYGYAPVESSARVQLGIGHIAGLKQIIDNSLEASGASGKTVKYCLDEVLRGQVINFGIRLAGPSGGCATTIEPEHLEFDDVEVFLDTSCKN